MPLALPFRGLMDPVTLRWSRWRAASARSPRPLIQLCRKHFHARRYERALEASRAGLSLFPYADELERLGRLAWAEVGANTVRRELERSSAEGFDSYERIIALHLEYGDLGPADDLARIAVRRFPHSARAHVLLATVATAQFREDRRAARGREALEAWRKAVHLDAKDARARLGFADFALELGATNQAAFHVLLALELDPQSEAARKLHGRIKKLPIERRREEDLLWEIEQHDEAAIHHRAEPRDPAYLAELREGLARLSLVPGVRTAGLRHRGLAILAESGTCRGLENRWERGVIELASVLRQEGSKLAKRLDMGRFVEADMLTDQGRAIALAAGPTVLLLTVDENARSRPIIEAAEEELATWTARWTEDIEWVRPARGAAVRQPPRSLKRQPA